MGLNTLQKFGGLSLMIGGLLLAVYVVLFNTLLPVEFMETDFSRLVLSPSWIPVCIFAFVAVILLVFGFTAAYSKLYGSSGVVGFAGYVALTTAYIFQAGQLVLEIFFYPAIASTESGLAIFREDTLITHPMAQAFTILFIVFIALGVVLFGITVLRSKVYSKVSGILFMVGAVLYAALPVFLLNLAGIIMFAVGCFLIGLRVWSRVSA